MTPQVLETPRSPAHRKGCKLWTPKRLAYSVQGKPVRTTTPIPARTGWSSLLTPSSTKPWARKSSVWKWCLAAAARIAYADIRRMGEVQRDAPIPPSTLVSKHTPSVRTWPTWARKKSLIWGMCHGPPRYYKPIDRQAGCSLILPLPERPGFSVASDGGPEPSGSELCLTSSVRGSPKW
jgi:hypothetical protein